ncbi:MAG: acyltransferase family protein [Lachnospiraceae bacterium]|nr:acyltransferase family protein [Lachnospiraceae bacterium]
MFTENNIVYGRVHHSGGEKRERDFGADVVRITALFLVLWVHYYLRNGFYYREVTDFGGFLTTSFRPVVMTCVPLFMMLTGYLKCGKSWNLKYYRSIVPVLLSYLIISAVHLPYRIFVQQESMTAGEWVLQFLHFELATYGWYVSMYIGLFLITPLLNLIWRSCVSRQAHLAVVFTFVLLTFVPATFNKTSCGNIVPNYFQSIYYVTYYMIGCFIRTYRPKPNRWILLALVVAFSVFLGWLNIVTRTEAGNYHTGFRTAYNGMPEGFLTTSMFLILYQFRCRRPAVRKLAAHISGVVFEVYLLSYLADVRIFPLFYKKYSMFLYIPVGIVMTMAVFILTYPIALAVNRFVRKIIPRTARERIGTAKPAFSKGD